MRRLLLTSFTTWKPEQPSNSSDDLLAILQTTLAAEMTEALAFVRQLPVDFEAAPRQAIAHIQQHQPNGIVCFGMAEKRDRLDLERQAKHETTVRQTRLDLEHLSQGLGFTRISDDAGDFVCNRLYFDLLGHLQPTPAFALFIHVPVLTEENQTAVVHDSWEILHRLLTLKDLRPLVPSAAPSTVLTSS